MTMAYILVVNANILSETGMDKGSVFAATAIASFIGSCAMGTFSKLSNSTWHQEWGLMHSLHIQ